MSSRQADFTHVAHLIYLVDHTAMHAPSGYVDLQVNGYADVDFNADELDAEEVAAVCRRLREDGVAGILATVITADIDAMCRRLANIAASVSRIARSQT